MSEGIRYGHPDYWNLYDGLEAYVHSADPARPGGELKDGQRSLTHIGTITVNYAYQVEQWAIDLDKADPKVHRIECPALRREWKRDATGALSEVTGPS